MYAGRLFLFVSTRIGNAFKLEGCHVQNAQLLPARFYNGRIACQYKILCFGLTTLRKQPHCHLALIIEETALPKQKPNH